MGFRGEAAGAVDDLTDEEFLRAVESSERARREAELELLIKASQWAVRRGPDAFDPEEKKQPFGERLRRYGGEGTPEVGSHAATDFALRLGRSESAGSRYLATALDGQYRLPRTWERVLRMEVEPSCLMFIARRTRHLSVGAAGKVDADVAEYADGRLPWSRFEGKVEAAVKAADPELARQREEDARRRQFARRVGAAEDGVAVFMIRGIIPVIAKLNATITLLAQILKALGEEGSEDQLRVQACLLIADPPAATALLAQWAAWGGKPPEDDPPPADPEKDPEPVDPESSAHPEPETDDDPDGRSGSGEDDPTGGDPHGREPLGPKDPDPGPGPEPGPPGPGPEGMVLAALQLWRAAGQQATGETPVIEWDRLLPQVSLFVHTHRPHPEDPEARGTGLSRIEQYGTVTDAWVRGHLGPHANFQIRQILDIEGQAPAGSHEIPKRHRQAVRQMTPADIFPWGTATVDQPDGWPGMQIDHTIAWRPPLPEDADQAPEEPLSRIGNYGPMTQFHHNLKTHGGMQVTQPFPGIYLWKDKWGAIYLVDHTGSRRIRTWTSKVDIDMDLVYVNRR